MLKNLHAFNIMNNTYDFNIHGNDPESFFLSPYKMELNNALAFGEGLVQIDLCQKFCFDILTYYINYFRHVFSSDRQFLYY